MESITTTGESKGLEMHCVASQAFIYFFFLFFYCIVTDKIMT